MLPTRLTFLQRNRELLLFLLNALIFLVSAYFCWDAENVFKAFFWFVSAGGMAIVMLIRICAWRYFG